MSHACIAAFLIADGGPGDQRGAASCVDPASRQPLPHMRHNSTCGRCLNLLIVPAGGSMTISEERPAEWAPPPSGHRITRLPDAMYAAYPGAVCPTLAHTAVAATNGFTTHEATLESC